MSNHFIKASVIPTNQIPAENPVVTRNENPQTSLDQHGTWQPPNPPLMYMFNPFFPSLQAPPQTPMPYNPYGSYCMSPMQLVPTAPTAPQGCNQPMFSSPSISTMSHDVSLSDFCTKYWLSTHTKERLEELNYLPGNKVVESLSEADWKEAGLSVLASCSFLAAHLNFCEVIGTGVWN